MTALTPRQQQILELLAQGLTRSEIAAELWVSSGTVSTHQRLIYARLGVHNAHGAVAAGYQTGLLGEPATTQARSST